MNTRCFVYVLLSLLGMPAFPCRAQSLADAARQERARRQSRQSPSKVFTNDDLSRYGEQTPSGQSTAEAAPPEEPAATATRSEGVDSADADERAWSKRFIDAKAKVQQAKSQGEALQAKLSDLNLKLMRADPQAGGTEVFDREHLYLPLIAQAKEKIEKNKSELAAAEAELEDLRDELRKSGKPASWAESRLALQPENKGGKAEPEKVKDQKYWMEQLGVIDKRYHALIAPLEEERFQLINRRPSAEGESTAPASTLGMGVPPRVIDIDVQIKELNQKRDREKTALIDKAIHEGALPGWFR
jgi:hypothetical protein